MSSRTFQYLILEFFGSIELNSVLLNLNDSILIHLNNFYEFGSIEPNKRKNIEILKNLDFGLDNFIQKIYKIQEICLNYKKIPSNFGEDYIFQFQFIKCVRNNKVKSR